MKKLLLFPFLFVLFIKNAFAHCPLCVVGAAAAAGGAKWMGVNTAAIGVFIGAFAIALGWWVSKLIKKQYFPLQKSFIIAVIFVTTVIPMLPMLGESFPIYVSLLGAYGSLLNRTYIFDLFLFGSIVGGFVVLIAPWFSSKITKLRKGKFLHYQGIVLTFAILIILAIIMQLVFKAV